jgi:uncharacterized protein YoxC
MLYITIPILAIIAAFFIFSVYTNRQAKYAQRVKAFELKQKHMDKTLEKIRSEIDGIREDIEAQQDKINALKSGKDIVDLSE